MSISDKIKEFQKEATLHGVESGLKAESSRLRELCQLLETSPSFEVVVGKRDDNWLFVLPIDYKDRTSFEDYVVDELGEALARYGPQKEAFGKYAAYSLKNRITGRLPSRLNVNINGFNLEFNVVRTETELLLPEHPTERKNSRGVPRKIASEMFKPNVKVGDKFEVELRSNSCFKYNLFYIYHEIYEKFPGYRIPFEIEYVGGVLVTHRTGANRETKVGELNGNYAAKGVKRFYDANPSI